jgi:16S rRNA (guanine966-N2)-methyltransferase
VVAGEARGLRLDVPGGTATRPTSDRVREAVFNALDSLGAVDGARVLDAFAGSGALGIEALSRGAEHAVFADTSTEARAVVSANLDATGLADRATIVDGDVTAAVDRGGPWDLVLLDPPYRFDAWDDLLVRVAAAVADDGVVVIESDREIELPPVLGVIRVKGYGGTVVTFAVPVGAVR